MRKTLLLTGGFDPASETEIQNALAYSRKGYEVYLYPEEAGILPLLKRLKLLELAVKPYRHLHAGMLNADEEVSFRDFAEEEAEIRTGCFNKAAHGTRKMLAEEGLYFEQIVDARCKPHRAAHSRSVAALCVELAHAHHLDEAQAWKAGMMHDITKKWDDEEGRRILSIYDPDKLDQNPRIWHSYTAPVWLRTVLGMHDAVILKAIYSHTLGFGRSDLARILYIADKCERTRGYDSEAEIAIAKKSLKEGAALVLAESKKYLKETQGIIA